LYEEWIKMLDVKHCTASSINNFEGFLHIFYCWIKNFTESLTEKLLRQVGWQGQVKNNRNSPHDVRSPDCRVLTQTYSPNFFSFRFWGVVVFFTAFCLTYLLHIISTSMDPCLENMSEPRSNIINIYLPKFNANDLDYLKYEFGRVKLDDIK
jgi:hypothetical protein